MTKTPDSVILPLRSWPAARLAIALLFLFASGCGRQNAAATPIRVAAASDLQMVLPRLIEQFTRKTGRQVTPSFRRSGHLAEQIKGGAPFDVFLAANQSFVRDLAEAGLIEPGSVRPYARGSLVLAVYEQVSGEITQSGRLARPGSRRSPWPIPIRPPTERLASRRSNAPACGSGSSPRSSWPSRSARRLTMCKKETPRPPLSAERSPGSRVSGPSSRCRSL